MYQLTIIDRESGEKVVKDFPNRSMRVENLPDVNKYRFYLTDPDVENEFDDLVFD